MERSKSLIAVPPGETIKEQLLERDMNQKEFSARMDMSEKHISRLINGEVQLTPETACKLEYVLGVPASFWNNLEMIYREKLIKVRTENAMETDIELAKKFPYTEMAKLGWVDDTKDIKERVINLRKFFEVVTISLLDNRQITRIACRRLAVTEKSDLALMAWAQEAKIQARLIDTERLNINGLVSAIPKIRNLMANESSYDCDRLADILADYGIALVCLPHLKGSFAQAASFQDGRKIVIGMTSDIKDPDQFRFSLFHELGHIVLGHILNHDEISKEDEKAADQWAKEKLIQQV